MARQTATARPSAQGKGKKAALTATLDIKRPRSRASPARAGKAASRVGVRHLDAVVGVGTAITFAPTGERLRVTKIEHGRITFEKLP